jgi:hypothetical protein
MNLETYTCNELQLLKDYLTWLQRYEVDIQKGLQQLAKAIELKEWERFVTVTRLLSLIENHDDSEGDLDDIVHDTAAGTASGINNTGLERQLNWLLDQGCAPGFILGHLGIKDSDLEEPDKPI